MIVWLNGTFGAGKTTTADALLPLLPGLRLFDPETVGAMLAANLSDVPVPNFQQWSAWRSLVVATATALTDQTGDDLIAAQTVLDEAWMTEILAGLRTHGHEVFHVLLDTDVDTLSSRILGSREALPWRLGHLPAYADARPWMVRAADLTVDTTAATPEQAAACIASAIASRTR